MSRYIRTSPLPVGLHCPVPYDGRLTRFEITGPSPQFREIATSQVTRTLEAAVQAGAAYVVVHFPTPYPRVGGSLPPGPAELIGETAAWLARQSDEYGVPVYLENMSFHPSFGGAADYRTLLRDLPQLRMCFDVGHAALSRHDNEPYETAALLAPYTESVHLYNTRTGEHALPSSDQEPAEGWIDLPRLLRALLVGGAVRYVVLEYADSGENDHHPPLRWIQALVEEARCGAR